MSDQKFPQITVRPNLGNPPKLPDGLLLELVAKNQCPQKNSTKPLKGSYNLSDTACSNRILARRTACRYQATTTMPEVQVDADQFLGTSGMRT